MQSAEKIIDQLIEKGVIPMEFKDAAVSELHLELSRRVRRTAQTLATLAAQNQLAIRAARLLES